MGFYIAEKTPGPKGYWRKSRNQPAPMQFNRASRRRFTSPGYVENLPVRKKVPVNWKKMRERYIPQGIMTFLGGQLGGIGGAMTGFSAYPSIMGILNQYR